MRTYFFGDIHGNAPALEACLKHMGQTGADAVFCLGDIAGWLPFGDRTLSRMRSAGFPTVAGNHDLLIAGSITDNPRQLDRMQATAYNAGLLFPMEGAIEYLLSLPLKIEQKDFTVVHHSPFALPGEDESATIETFNYLDETALAQSLAAWGRYPKHLIVSGHDHVPAIFELTGPGSVKTHLPQKGTTHLTVSINSDSRYWVKAGSVGGPYRDGVPAANSVLFDSGAGTITLYRIPYDAAALHNELAAHRFCRNIPTIRKYVELLASI